MFRYQDFKDAQSQIRLLVVDFGTCQESMHFKLHTYERESCPEYFAVSYVWGSKKGLKIIYLDGYKLKVRRNLYQFLQRIERWPYAVEQAKQIYLWVDAICINQKNIDERSAQVEVMGEIYKATECVLVWLGEPDEEEFYSLETAFSDFITFCRGLWHQHYNVSLVDTSVPKIHSHSDDEESDHISFDELWYSRDPDGIDWDIFEKICKLEYWKRAWVHQEILLAEDCVIFCGEQLISWEQIWHVAAYKTWLDRRGGSIGKAQRRFKIPHLLLQCGTITGLHLKDLMVEYRDCKCEMLHDKVYAFRAMACDGDRIQVDYTKTRKQLFKNQRFESK